MRVAPGIASVSTESHGGLWLNAERQQELPAALAAFTKLLAANPPAFNLVAADCAAAAQALGQPERAIALLQEQYQRAPSMHLLRALATVQPGPQREHARHVDRDRDGDKEEKPERPHVSAPQKFRLRSSPE